MKTLKDLTPEIKAKIPQYINNAVKGVFDGGRYNNFSIEKAEKAVHYNYEKCGYNKPVVLVAENIYEQQVIFNYIKSNESLLNICILIYNLKNGCNKTGNENHKIDSQLYSKLDSKIESQLRYQIDYQLGYKLESQLYSQIHSQLDSQIHSQLDSQLRSQLRSQLYSQLYSQLDYQLDSQLRSQLRSQLDYQLDYQLYSQLRSQLDYQLDYQLYSQLRSQLDSQLRSQLGSKSLEYNSCYLFTLNVYSDVYYNWFEFIRKEFGLCLSINDSFQETFKLQRESGIYSAIFSEVLCVVSKYPKKVHRNDDLQMHNTNGVACEWGYLLEETKFNCYYINGRECPENIFNEAKTLTKERFINEENEDYKAMWYEIIGQEKMMEILGAEMIDSGMFVHENGDLETVELYKTTEKIDGINDYLAWIKFICPSTGSNYLIDVEPRFSSAKEAAISTSPFYGMEINNIDDYKFVERT